MSEKKAVKKKRAPRAKKTEEVQLKETTAAPPAPGVKKEPKPHLLPKENVFEATGRRKTAAAHVYIYKGTGKITVNSKPYDEYFCRRPILLETVVKPLKEVDMLNAFDVQARTFGGGIPSQADAIRLGIARALIKANSELRGTLRALDLLRRDPRVKERKKYGLKRARRAFQYTKR